MYFSISKELLEREGIDFIIDASSITECLDSSLEIEERLKKLVYDKGVSMHEKYPYDVVISADTTIYHSGKIFGKSGEGFQRINVACPRSTVKEALDRVKAALKN